MPDERMDVLILNTAVLDLRSPDFGFADELVGPGGLAKCDNADMPGYSQEQIKAWIGAGCATAGGLGNTAPLLARAGFQVAVGANLGGGGCDGLDVQGRAIYDIMTANGVDVSAFLAHPTLPTGTTFIHDATGAERGGIAYFANANDDFDFSRFRPHVQRLRPRVVYYMYSGLSARGDANEGRDLAAFIAWCREQGCITIADSHTFCADPEALIRAGTAVPEYRLLEPLLPEVDIFFTSWDEARMIRTTLEAPQPPQVDPDSGIPSFLAWCAERFGAGNRAQLFGVTVKDGAFALPHGTAPAACVQRYRSQFMCGDVVDLVGAGDSFRAGLIGYVARNASAFRTGQLDVDKAIQMGNLMASLFIKAPLDNRYGNIRPYEALLRTVSDSRTYGSFPALLAALDTAE